MCLVYFRVPARRPSRFLVVVVTLTLALRDLLHCGRLGSTGAAIPREYGSARNLSGVPVRKKPVAQWRAVATSRQETSVEHIGSDPSTVPF
jgi:hypothetical protein